MKNYVFKLHPNDDVLVALRDLNKADIVHFNGNSYQLNDQVAAGDKFFIHDLQPGAAIHIHGMSVGKSLSGIACGDVLNETNVKANDESKRYRPYQYTWQAPVINKFRERTFNGYHRGDGRVGTANYWLFIPTVFCENRNLDVIREALHNELGYSLSTKYKQATHQLAESYKKGENMAVAEFVAEPVTTTQRVFKNIDGIKFLNHQGGCGGTRQDAALLSKLLAAYADHPNVAGITVLSLGCQNLQVKDFKRDLEHRHPGFDKPLFIFEQQQSQSEEQLITHAIRQTFLGLIEANRQERQPAALDKLVIGVNGDRNHDRVAVTASPAIGYCSDLLVALGGKVLLTEFNKMYDVTQAMLDRLRDENKATKLIRLTGEINARMYQHAPRMVTGNSLTGSPARTIANIVQSAAAISKGGTSPVEDVLDYTEPAVKKGLNLVCTSPDEIEGLTGQVASGATLILYEIHGSALIGNPVCPTITVGYSLLADKANENPDIDSRSLFNSATPIEELGEEILEYCIRVASGEEIPRAVMASHDDFVPWKKGVSL